MFENTGQSCIKDFLRTFLLARMIFSIHNMYQIYHRSMSESFLFFTFNYFDLGTVSQFVYFSLFLREREETRPNIPHPEGFWSHSNPPLNPGTNWYCKCLTFSVFCLTNRLDISMRILQVIRFKSYIDDFSCSFYFFILGK